MATAPVIYTIGHSTRSADDFVALLEENGVKLLVDVRTVPRSARNPQFNRETLASELKNSGMEYVFLGHELGARSEDPSCYRNGRAQYSLIVRTPVFERGIQRLLAGMQRFRLAILCAEKEPLACHRSILISRALQERGVQVEHILEDGSLENHNDSLLRLLHMHGIRENHLFLTREELISTAYEKQAEEIEYAADLPTESA